VYQGIWFRHLQGLFGVTTHALAVVVAAFMGGLAAGSWALGRAADRSRRPLRLYGLLELGVAGLVPLVPLVIRGIEALYVALHPHLAGSLVLLSLLRLGLALGALLVPTLLMGGTLPALVVWMRRSAAPRAELHRDLARLYGINTLGAVAGTVLVGFVLLAQLGLWRTTLLAVAVNAAIGLWCIRRDDGSAGPPQAAASPGGEAGVAAPAPSTLLLRWSTIAFAVSGAASLAYEVAWTRVLAQIIGSSTYAFSMILSAFLLGLGAGSIALERWRGRDRAGLWGFSWAQLGIGASASLVVPLLVRLPDLQLRAFRGVEHLGGVLAVQFGLCLLVVFVPAFFMGATFPLLSGYVAGRRAEVGQVIGRLYAGNTLGGIAGSMLAGFVLLPHLGTQRTLLVSMLVNASLALGGFGLLWRAGGRAGGEPARRTRAGRARQLAAAAAAIVLFVVALRTPAWDPYALDAGLAVAGPAVAHGAPGLEVRHVSHGSDILYYREGLNANISVRQDEAQLYLKTNGKTDGTSKGDMPTQLMLGLLPSLVHPEPRRTLVIGLGTGASARAALAPTGLERLDVVEIEPAVVEAAREWFGVVNDGLFEDPRLHLWVDDARAFLLTTPERYDLIVSEPSNPWIAGVANLFAVEHYRRCAARLAPGGIVTQWLQIYAMDFDLVRMVLASMQAVFPHLAVYSFHHGDLIVLASATPLPGLEIGALAERLRAWEMEATVQRILEIDTAAGLLGFHLLDAEDVLRLVHGATTNTEDRPRLEFAAPRSLYLPTRDSNAARLVQARRRPLPGLAPGTTLRGPDYLDLARAALRARRPADAEAWAGLAARDPDTPRAAALEIGGRAAVGLGRPGEARARFEAALRLEPRRVSTTRELAELRLMQGHPLEAMTLLESTCRADSTRGADLRSCERLLDVALRMGRAGVVQRLAADLGSAPDSGRVRDEVQRARLLGLAARVCIDGGDAGRGERLARASLARNPRSTEAWRALGMLAYGAGDWREAARWWERLVEYRQTGVDVLLPLAQAYQRAGDRRRARRYVEWVLAQEPDQALARRMLAELR
jgi:spermidine synthase